MLDPLERVVRVYQKNTVVRLGLGVCSERFQFRVKGKDPTMSMGSGDRNVVDFSREQVGSTSTTADVCCTSGRQAAIHALCSTKPELNHRFALSSEADARGLGCDQ